MEQYNLNTLRGIIRSYKRKESTKYIFTYNCNSTNITEVFDNYDSAF